MNAISRCRLHIFLATACIAPSMLLAGTTQGNLSRTPKEIAAMVYTAEQADMHKSEEGMRICHELFSDNEPVEDCSVRLLSNGRAVIVNAVRECSGDSCYVESLVVTDKGLERVLNDVGGVIEIDRTRRYAYIDSVRRCNLEAVEKCIQTWHVVILRIDLMTGAEESWVECFSPKASPDGKWIYCRDYNANVWRFADGTRELEPVWENDRPEDGVYNVPYAWLYPQQVWFEKDGLVFDVINAEGDKRTITLSSPQ